MILIAYKGVELFGLGPGPLVAVVSALFILPFVLFSPYSGVLSDKYNRVTVTRYVKWAELVIMLIASIGFATNNYYILIFSLFLMGTQSTFFGPVKYSIPPELVARQDISIATGYIELGTFIAILLGTILGGYLSSIDSWLLISAVLVLVSVVGIIFSYLQPLSDIKTNTELTLGYNILAGHGKLYALIKKQGLVLRAIVLNSIFWFLGAGILTLLPTFCKDMLRASEQVVTLFLAIFTVGIAVGSIVCGKLSNHKVELAFVPLAAVGVLIFSFDLYWINQTVVAQDGLANLSQYLDRNHSLRTMIDFFAISFFGGVYIVPLYAYFQESSLEGTLSRVIAANNIINALFMVVVSGLMMLLFSFQLTASLNILVVSILFFVASIVVFFTSSQFKKVFLNKFNKS